MLLLFQVNPFQVEVCRAEGKETDTKTSTPPSGHCDSATRMVQVHRAAKELSWTLRKKA
jgi:hypothetical protein